MCIPLHVGEYDKSTKEVTVLLRGLAFANGVALSKDKSIVLVAENSTGKIVRYWLKGPRAGQYYTSIDLTGYPDNIERNSKGELLFSKLVTFNSWLGKTVLKHPVSIQQQHFILVRWQAHVTAIKLSEDGQVLEVLEDFESKTLECISEVEDKNDWFCNGAFCWSLWIVLKYQFHLY
ncbi:Protein STRICTOSIDINE SYNTHASE-LIKE 10 [Capsicum annuum]|uniref:Protein STRICTOSIDINE SYNTHASE-LIKE 10 n=1 Tax=Capsicum annuum TaxID=4072 RepID=A0A2G2YGM2_CAPAN|nr:Protein STRICTOSIDINE SYNTHASE-LIKE 10 [Capsicum annuum]